MLSKEEIISNYESNIEKLEATVELLNEKLKLQLLVKSLIGFELRFKLLLTPTKHFINFSASVKKLALQTEMFLTRLLTSRK